METNIIVDISPPIPYLAKFWFSSYGPKCCQPIKLQDSLKCNISRMKWMMKFIFGMQINIEVFYNIFRKAWGEWSWFFAFKQTRKKLIVSHWVCVAMHTQSTQNNKFTISLVFNRFFSRKTWRMKLIFCQQINVKGFFKLLLSF